MTLVEKWRQARAGITRKDFGAFHPYAFLVSVERPQVPQAAVEAKARLDFRTQVHGASLSQPLHHSSLGATTTELSRTSGLSLEPLVMPLKKTEGNPFPDRISIGRAVNCDIVVRDSSISKLHGHFCDVTSTSAVYTDAKSSNGTFIDGARVQPGVRVEIHGQGLIALGRVRLQLLSASDLYDWL